MEPVTTAKSLERIADALEALLPILERLATPMIVYTVPTTAPPVATPSGYRCGSCGTWVMPGTYHSCSGRPWSPSEISRLRGAIPTSWSGTASARPSPTWTPTGA